MSHGLSLIQIDHKFTQKPALVFDSLLAPRYHNNQLKKTPSYHNTIMHCHFHVEEVMGARHKDVAVLVGWCCYW